MCVCVGVCVCVCTFIHWGNPKIFFFISREARTYNKIIFKNARNLSVKVWNVLFWDLQADAKGGDKYLISRLQETFPMPNNLEGGAGGEEEGCFFLTLKNEKKYCNESRRTRISCIQYPAYNILHTISCVQYPAYNILHTISCIQYPAYNILHTISCIQ